MTNSQKAYVIDTNVLLDDPQSLLKLRNGDDNQVFIPYHVLLELNKFKKNPKFSHIVAQVIQYLHENPDQFTVLDSPKLANTFTDLVDSYILDEITESGLERPILVTNDKMLRLRASLVGINSENYKDSVPFKSEAEYFTGFVADDEPPVYNSFRWSDQGKPLFNGPDGEKIIDYQHNIWRVTPRNVYQNLALELLTQPKINVVSMQSDAGYGKSFLALASALYLTLEKKWHNKIYVVKPMIEIGQKMGYLPGRVEEKMEPYTRYVNDLMKKLHALRPANKILTDSSGEHFEYKPNRFELLPLTYIRGMNIENAVVIIDEVQNMSRVEARAILSRMGEGVKCICLGDVNQVDNPYLSNENNGLNWIVNKFKGNRIYAHLVLKGDKSRGPITDLVIKSGL